MSRYAVAYILDSAIWLIAGIVTGWTQARMRHPWH
jgi:hypothetical protein